MAKPHSVRLMDWNNVVSVFQGESDRGAAIIAGSFLENALGTFLMHQVQDKKIGKTLFGATGPLNSFAQRIAVAYAFAKITKPVHDAMEHVRKARNHFAHHPFDATFASPEVRVLVETLPLFNELKGNDYGLMLHRVVYLMTCAHLSAVTLSSTEPVVTDASVWNVPSGANAADA